MTAKEFLYSIRDEQREIDELRRRIFELEASLLPSGIRYDLDKVDSSPRDRLSETISEIADYQAVLKAKVSRLNGRRMRAQEMIDWLDDSLERQVLDIYFLSGRRVGFSDVGEEVGYSERQVYRLYQSAMAKIDGKLSSNVSKCQ